MGKSILNKNYGWRPSLPDIRDHKFSFSATPASLPTFQDLRPQFPTVYNQQQLGSCTANALAAAVEFDLIKQKLPIFIPSRLFIYYNERSLEGTIATDSGATLTDGAKAINKWGAPPETLWAYNVNKFATKPPASVFAAGLKTKSVLYQSITQDITDMKACIASGYGFVFGFTVYESFESNAVASTGIVPMPGANEQVLGGHAVVAVGYNDGPNSVTVTINGVKTVIPPQYVIVRNSWGPFWGLNGYFLMPYNYITNSNLADDFWKIQSVL